MAPAPRPPVGVFPASARESPAAGFGAAVAYCGGSAGAPVLSAAGAPPVCAPRSLANGEGSSSLSLWSTTPRARYDGGGAMASGETVGTRNPLGTGGSNAQLQAAGHRVH